MVTVVDAQVNVKIVEEHNDFDALIMPELDGDDAGLMAFDDFLDSSWEIYFTWPQDSSTTSKTRTTVPSILDDIDSCFSYSDGDTCYPWPKVANDANIARVSLMHPVAFSGR